MRGRGTRTPTTTRGTNHITPSRKAQRSGAVRGVSAARQAPQSVLREKDLLRNNEALNLRGALVDLAPRYCEGDLSPEGLTEAPAEPLRPLAPLRFAALSCSG